MAIAASYPDDVAQHFVGFLSDGGVQVVSMGSHGIVTAAEVGTLEPSQVVAMVTAAVEVDVNAEMVNAQSAAHAVKSQNPAKTPSRVKTPSQAKSRSQQPSLKALSKH